MFLPSECFYLNGLCFDSGAMDSEEVKVTPGEMVEEVLLLLVFTLLLVVGSITLSMMPQFV